MATEQQKTKHALILMITPAAALLFSFLVYGLVNWAMSAGGNSGESSGAGTSMHDIVMTIANTSLFVVGMVSVIAFIPCLVIGLVMLSNRNKDTIGKDEVVVTNEEIPPELQKYIKLARATSIILAIVYFLGIITIPIGIWHIVFASHLSTKKLPAQGMVKATAIISIFACWSLLAIFICIFFWHFNGILRDIQNGEKIEKTRFAAAEPTTALVIACLGIAVLIIYYIGVGVNSASSSYQSSSTSLDDTTAQLVASAKLQTHLPEKIDDVTTLTDITSSGSDIQYHDTIAGADPTAITESELYTIDKPAVCGNSDLASYLQEGIGFQYIYTVAETGAQYTVTITSSDC